MRSGLGWGWSDWNYEKKKRERSGEVKKNLSQGSEMIPGTHVKSICFKVRETAQQWTGIRCPAVDADIIQG